MRQTIARVARVSNGARDGYNKHGTAEQWIKEGKAGHPLDAAVVPSFRANEAGRVNVFETTWFSITVATPRHRRGATTTDRAAVAAGNDRMLRVVRGAGRRSWGILAGPFSTAD